MYARRTQLFFRARTLSSNTMPVCINLTLLQRKSCVVHMTVFEIVVHQLDTIIEMIYLGADNSSIDCRETLVIDSYRNCMICFDAT